MAVTIEDIKFQVDTCFRSWEINAQVRASKSWDTLDDELHIDALKIMVHNCGSGFAKSFPCEYDVADSYLVCNSEVNFDIRRFKGESDIEELVQDFVQSWCLGIAPFAMEYGWWWSVSSCKA